MSVPTEIIHRLASLNLSARAYREVLSIIADALSTNDDRKARDRERKRRGSSAENPNKFRGNSAEIPGEKPSPKEKVSPTPPSKTQPPTIRGGGDDARARPLVSDRARQIVDEIGKSFGFVDAIDWPPGWVDAGNRVQMWLDNQWREDVIITSVKAQARQKTDGAPSTISYFEKGIARAHAKLAAPLPVAKIIPMQEVQHVQQRPDHIGSAIERVRARMRSEDDASADKGPRPDEDRGHVEILPPRPAK